MNINENKVRRYFIRYMRFTSIISIFCPIILYLIYKIGLISDSSLKYILIPGYVLNEPGQFTTTHGGRCDMQATTSSRLAVAVAYFMKKLEVIPSNILFFNCIGYNGYTPYSYFGGNYFMTYGKEN